MALTTALSALTKPGRLGRFRQALATAPRPLVSLGAALLPKGLYARALMIIITPIVLLMLVVTYVFLERHFAAVTRRLSEATARDIAALIDIYETLPRDDGNKKLTNLALERLDLTVAVLPPGELPPPMAKPFIALLDRALTSELHRRVKYPFWIDTVGLSSRVEIRVKTPTAILRFTAERSQTYASNSHIFIVWMVVTSIILLSVAILFLRNQIRPILQLADAADAFGKGRPVPPEFKPRGAREVRQAAQAFIEMRNRITTHVEQRTTMLAGVSHDLRTVLTRFKLELEMLGSGPDVEAMRRDVNEMQHMLEDYLAFARGDGGEVAAPTDLKQLLEEVIEDAQIYGTPIELRVRRSRKPLHLPLKRQAFKRAVSNLISNAARFGDTIVVRAAIERRVVRIEVDDDGPGIPPDERDNVFRPFYRLDHARNQVAGNSGLGLAIARDIARSHGGNIMLGDSSLGGLRAVITVPL
jgi:two-component system osmolarity sensor histidine kinase EnvZ